MKPKFTLIDYLIIILVICAIAFAFIHITTDDSSNIKKTAFDASTINKIPDTYSNYYKDGFIVKANVDGFNATNNEKTTLNGTVKWIGNNGGTDVRILIESNNSTYLAGLYKSVPEADIYIDKISLETDGSTYPNLVEIKANPENINNIIGHKKENVLKLKEFYDVDVIVKPDENIKKGKFEIEIDKTYEDILEELKAKK